MISRNLSASRPAHACPHLATLIVASLSLDFCSHRVWPVWVWNFGSVQGMACYLQRQVQVSNIYPKQKSFFFFREEQRKPLGKGRFSGPQFVK